MSLARRPALLLALLLATTDHGHHRPAHEQAPDPREEQLRARLEEDPNDTVAFNELAEIVRRHGSQSRAADPLTADVPQSDPRSADLAVWALAEELAGRPNAWYPLIELARLSVEDDLDGANRRLGAACAREETGLALAESLWVLRESGHPTHAHALATAHWDAEQHVPAAGRQIVLAAIESERYEDAEKYLELLDAHEDEESAAVVTELRSVLEDARNQ
ncbi:hypothetical protein [Georgenia sp. Z1491]|uniref:hypothetical protein n=1 Tax=Georgenia sp. Z1491 TaxID=3416707 RepID=UPI003CED6130